MMSLMEVLVGRASREMAVLLSTSTHRKVMTKIIIH